MHGPQGTRELTVGERSRLSSAVCPWGGWLLLLSFSSTSCACSARQDAAEPPAEPAEVSNQVVPTAPKCVGSDDEPVECIQDADCCVGFVCSTDPQLSYQRTFCVFAGEEPR